MRSFALTIAKLALVGLLAATTAAYLGALAWPFELFAHFRPQLAAANVVILLVVLVLGRLRLAVVGLALVVANAAPLSDHLRAHFGLHAQARLPADDISGNAGTAGRSLRVLTYNMLGDYSDQAAFHALLRAERPDVVVLTELPSDLRRRMAEFDETYPHRLISQRQGPHEVAVFSRWPIAAIKTSRDADLDLPVVSLDLCAPAATEATTSATGAMGLHPSNVTTQNAGPCFRLVALHGLVPFGRGAALRNMQLDVAARFARTAPSGLAILAGDLNLTPWTPTFAHLLARSGLQDTSPLRGLAATWHTRNLLAALVSPVLGLSIDHVLASPAIQARAVRIADPIGSDHRPVIVDLTLPPA